MKSKKETPKKQTEEPEQLNFHYPHTISREAYDALTEAAKNLFEKFDMVKVTVDQICQEAKVSRVTFYKEFKNKQYLLFALMLEIDKDFEKVMRQMMQEQKPFEEILEKLFAMAEQEEQLMPFLVREELLHPEFVRISNLYYTNMEENWRFDLFDLGIKSGFFRKDIDKTFAVLLLQNLTNFYFDLLAKGRYSPGQLEKMVVESFFYGLSNYAKKP